MLCSTDVVVTSSVVDNVINTYRLDTDLGEQRRMKLASQSFCFHHVSYSLPRPGESFLA